MRRALQLTAFLAWAVLLLAGYFVTHKPPLSLASAGPAAARLDLSLFGQHWLVLGRDVCAALGIFLASLGLGRRLLGRYHLDNLDGLALQAALGGGIFSLGWLGLSAAGLALPWVAWGILAIALVFFYKDIHSGCSQLTVIKDYWAFAGTLERVFLGCAAFLALNQLWTALAPPLSYDALTYHLAIPFRIASTGILSYLPANPYWGHPLLAEMLFTWAVLLGRPETAALTGWFFAAAALLGTAGLAARWLPDPDDARKVSAAVSMTLVALLASATVRWMSARAYTDLFSALMGLGGLACLFAWRNSGRRGWIYWMGIFVGFAVSTKYSAGVLALLLFPAAWMNPGVNRRVFSNVILSGLLSLLIFAPWALRDYLYTGSPLFPYVFATADYSPSRLAAANLAPEQVNWLASATLPVSTTWLGVDGAAGPGTDLGPLLVLFAVPGLLAARSGRTRTLAAGLGLVWAFIALAGARFGHLQQPRLYFVLLPALGCAAGWGWSAVQQIQSGAIRLRRITGALVLFSLALVLAGEIPRPFTSGALPTAIGLQSSADYLYTNTGAYYEAMRAISDLPTGSKTLMLWEGRALYAPANAIPDPWLDRWRTDYHEHSSPEEIRVAWKSHDYTHVLLYADGARFMRESDTNLSAADWLSFDRFFAALPPPLELTGSHYLLYSLP